MSFSWFSCDKDNGKVVDKTDVHDDGTVHRYSYVVPDEIKKGHGHEKYDSMESFVNGDEPSWKRDKDDERSKNRPWTGNGYELTIDELNEMKEQLINMKINTTIKILMKK